MEIKFYLKMKIPFEIQELDNQKIILINNEVFDWGLDEEALDQANKISSNPNALKAIHFDIKNYFLECIQEYLGFKPTIKQIIESLKVGYIEND